uniref:Ovule protein n=1 Tax=Mesocestoides corti TaxID=53468 RepID=A0A5K3EI59_MESCO
IKTLIVKQKSTKKRTYSRTELLEIKGNCKQVEPPEFLDDRLLRGKNPKDCFCRTCRNCNSSCSRYVKSLDENHKAVSSNQSYTEKEVVAKVHKKSPKDKRCDVRQINDNVIGRNAKPAWFTEGPKNI